LSSGINPAGDREHVREAGFDILVKQ